jgi:dipeptidyl aminopeptidase/acylaminoacyl peptidase
MLGRLHYYEGYSMAEVALPVLVMARLGAGVMVATCAAGSLKTTFRRDDIVVVADHINLMGGSPLIGLETGAEARLTWDAAQHSSSPIWSPDGKWLVFVHHEWGGDFYASVIAFNEAKVPYKGEDRYNKQFNSDIRVVVNGRSEYNQPFRFQWTPDGRKLVFASGDKDNSDVGTIYVVDVSSGSVTKKMQPPGFGPNDVAENVDLSNDGQKIAFKLHYFSLIKIGGNRHLDLL